MGSSIRGPIDCGIWQSSRATVSAKPLVLNTPNGDLSRIASRAVVILKYLLALENGVTSAHLSCRLPSKLPSGKDRDGALSGFRRVQSVRSRRSRRQARVIRIPARSISSGHTRIGAARMPRKRLLSVCSRGGRCSRNTAHGEAARFYESDCECLPCRYCMCSVETYWVRNSLQWPVNRHSAAFQRWSSVSGFELQWGS